MSMPLATQNPLATAEPWDHVSHAYTAELLPLFELFSRDALRLADLPPAALIADVACGPGTLSLLAAAQGHRVEALDFSAQMLTQFRQRAAGLHLQNRIEIQHGDGQHLPFSDKNFDAAFSMFGLIFFPDRIAGFRELYRTLKPNRPAIISSWAPFEGVFGIMMDIVRAHVPELPFGQGQAPLGTPEAYQSEMSAAGFTHIQVQTIPHDLPAPSAADFWASAQRTNVAIILLQQKLGPQKWSTLSPSILKKLQTELGEGPILVRARAHIAIAT
ncbi:MAG TPA: methyltransferase domain-containing protein [Phycisphaerae bacterium]|jgi:ubiquinone/menaquinone biosynthesis C-methylase UbiE